MRKILTGIAFAIVVAAGVGNYSLTLFAQQLIERDLTGAFAALRAILGTGSVGKVEFDLAGRTFKLSDVVLKSEGPNTTTVKIRELSGTGIDIPADRRFSAKTIEALDVEITAPVDLQPVTTMMVYQVPRITVSDFNGPLGLLRPLDSKSPIDLSRLVLEHIVASSASAISIPTVTAAMAPSGLFQPVISMNYTYSGLGLRDMRNGRIAALTADGSKITITTPSTALGQFSIEGGKESLVDFDANVLLAALATGQKEDRALRLAGRMTAGPYTARFENGMTMQIGALVMDGMQLRPSKLHIPELLELAEKIGPAGNPPSPDQARDLINLIADLYEGFSFGLFEITDVSVNVPQTAPIKLGAFRMKGFENGKLAEFAIEGVEGQTPGQQPVKVGRAALLGLDFAKSMRIVAELADGKETPEKIAAAISLLAGVEVKDVVAPYKNTNQTVQIDTLAVSWGQYVGPIPTNVRMTARMTGPIDPSDQDPFKMLAAAGLTKATIAFDLGAAWTEATKILALAPASVEIIDLFALNARASVGNVPRGLFTVDEAQATQLAMQVEVGLIELTLRDAGALELALAQFAKQQGLSLPDARKMILDTVNQASIPFLITNADFKPVVDAIVQFIQAPRSTITLRVVPNGKIAVQELIEAATANPFDALSQFRIEVTTSR